MGRSLALAAAAVLLAAAAVWLLWASPGDGIVSRAQLWGGPSTRPGAVVRPGAAGCVLEQVDPRLAPTSLCMSCHDGTAGPQLEFRTRLDDPGSSHPVDVDYAAAYARQPDKYVPPAALPEDVPLVEGKVACTSCHDPKSTAPDHVSQPGSLCDACHLM